MKKVILLVGVVVLVMSVQVQAVTVAPATDAASASALASAIVGTGISISNIDYTGAPGASGTFTGGMASGIGIESGILLTSGSASLAGGDNNIDDGHTGNNGLVGSTMLDQLVPGYKTYDATILSFDFTVTGAVGTTFDLFFNYVFASEEYNEWVDSSFNDVFGFFLDGTAVSNNVALVPDTTNEAVSIDNVNNDSNAAYYNDNDPSTGSSYDFQYDGFTDVFQVAVTGLAVGDTHSIALAIADAGDHALDSGVFIQGSSFSTEPEIDPVPEPGTLLLLGFGLAGLALHRRKNSAK